jgi:cytochrome c biogenesis protein CcmG, thiol:disulfide interchange protein DsbE
VRHSRLLIVGFIVVLAVRGASAAGPVKPGDPAPVLRLQAGDGKVVSLADYKGRVVLIDFWASWCGPCRLAFPAINDLYVELRDRGFDALAVNLDERRKDADQFLTERPHALTVLFDPKGESAISFGLGGMPSSFVVDREGRIRFAHTGYTPATLDDYRREILMLLRESAPAERQP